MNKFIAVILSSIILSGCINVYLGEDTSDEKEKTKSDTREIMLANPLNVYRTSTNIVIRAMTKNKFGKWVETDKEVIIPSGWYFASGVDL